MLNNKDGFLPSPELDFARSPTEWTLLRLSELLTERSEKNDGACEVFSVSVRKGFVNQIEHLGRSYSAADTSNYNLVRPFDIVYTKSPTGEFPFGVIKQSLIDHNVVVSPLYGVFEPRNETVGRFIAAYFDVPARANLYLSPIISKGAKNTIQISNETFLSSVIPFPVSSYTLEIIVDCVSSVDDLVVATSEKLSSLRAYKAAIVQRLLPKKSIVPA